MYTGFLNPIPTAFAKANGVKPALFSANSEGAAQLQRRWAHLHRARLHGDRRHHVRGVQGKRYQAAVLEYRLAGKNIVEVLAMRVSEAE